MKKDEAYYRTRFWRFLGCLPLAIAFLLALWGLSFFKDEPWSPFLIFPSVIGLSMIAVAIIFDGQGRSADG